MRILILGGSSEASALARWLAGRRDIAAVLSLAGRTVSPLPSPIAVRTGGFGGALGLAHYLEAEGVEAVVDATHPFAAQMSRNAAQACELRKTPLLGFSRPPWTFVEGDCWIEVPDMRSAVVALGVEPRTAFLTVGRLSLDVFEIAPQHRYVVRTIDAPQTPLRLPQFHLIKARGPFEVAQEEELMRGEGVEVVVTKNSGGFASAAKLVAARKLGLEVVIIQRPTPPDIPMVYDVESVLAWLEGHFAPP